jgi:transcriptional regulator with XRE-family HTH domain
MAPDKRADPELPQGAARDLVDLFKLLRSANPLRVGQIASRTGYAPSHISEVLRGRKAPSPDAAARIAQVLGGDENTVRRARRRAEDLKEWKRDNAKGRNSAREALGDHRAATSMTLPLYRELRSPDVTISILAGDLLDQKTHLAVGFSDTFDTSIEDDRIIHSSSLQGQLLKRLFDGDQDRLDEQLATALAAFSPVTIEARSDKPYGKLARYPLGTTAVLGEPRRLIFATAYGHMGNDLVTRAPLEGLWFCFNQLWEAVYRYGQRGALSIPIMGAGLARVDFLDRGNLLRLILLSFVAYSRRQLICHELQIIITYGEARRIDVASLSEFLRSL